VLAVFGRVSSRGLYVLKQLVVALRLSYARRVKDFFGFDVRVLDRARSSRDARFDGKFFIAVTSTKIYCRPVCRVRDAKRSNVRYYPTAAAAAEAGFRPCLRCRPEAAPGTPAWLGTLAVVGRGLRLIEDGFIDEHSVDELAQRLGMGTRHLHRLFVQHVGASPIAVAQTRRLHFAKRLLDETHLPITSIALASGFGSIRRFNDVFRLTYRRPPREIRKSRAAEAPTAGMDEVVLRLAYRPPYDWNHLRHFLAARAIPRIEMADRRRYARTVVTPEGGWAIVQVRQLDGENALELRVSGAEPTALLRLLAVARRVFDLAADPATIAMALADDPLLAPLVGRRPGLRIPGAWDAFECAVGAIAAQQLSAPEGNAVLGRLVERTGQPIATPITGLTHLFPAPAALVAADLRGLGLTDPRIAAIRELSIAVVEGTLDFGGTTEEIIGKLARIRGVGASAAQYVALRALGEPDAFPAADPALRRSTGSATALSTAALEKRAEAWRPWRAYAAIHLAERELRRGPMSPVPLSASMRRSRAAWPPPSASPPPAASSRRGYRGARGGSAR
jgi:AraC family transcriptional regulator of adaptative response / DNA-3-methyladenine glycosylase II